MSTQKALVLYHNDTNTAGPAPRQNKAQATQRHSPFLVQLMVGAEPDLRRRLGRTDLAEARVAAYGRFLAQYAKPAVPLKRLGEA